MNLSTFMACYLNRFALVAVLAYEGSLADKEMRRMHVVLSNYLLLQDALCVTDQVDQTPRMSAIHRTRHYDCDGTLFR